MSGARALVLLLSTATLLGCGVDEDSLICAPGRERVEGVCVDAESEDVADGDASALPLETDVCHQFFQCDAPYYCTAHEAPGRCRLRCDHPDAPACDEGFSCTTAGVCREEGTLRLDEPCGAGAERCDAAHGYACPDSGTEPVCHPLCDPYDPQRDCRGDETCQPLQGGAGICVSP